MEVDVHAELFGDGVLQESLSLHMQFATFDPSYPAATSILVGAFAARARIQQAFRFGHHYTKNYCFPFSQTIRLCIHF